MNAALPPLPPGFNLDAPAGGHPPLPPGFALDGAAAASAPAPAAQSTAPPSMVDRLQTNPVIGAPLQTALRAGQGVEQLLAHGAATASDLGGNMPNPVSRAVRGFSDRVDAGVQGQNQNYEQAKQRVVNASTDPRLAEALTSTGEIMGNMLNPAGMAGNAVKAAPGIASAATRGAVSGAGFGASQPVLDPNANYWGEKATQTGAGAATGGVTGAAAARLGGERMRPSEPPTTKQLKAAASEAYKTAEDEGVVIRQSAFKRTADDIKSAVEKGGLDATLHPKTTAVLSRFTADAENGDLTLEKAETLRRVASSALDSQDKSDRRLAHIVIDKLDDFVGNLEPADVASNGDASIATEALSKARDLYSRSAKSATIERLVERAKNRVGANYTSAGYETAIRQQFRSLADNDRAMQRFSPDEKAAILKVVRGGPVENVLRWAGKAAVRGPVSAIPTMAALHYGGPEMAALVEGGGEVAKFGAGKIAEHNVRMAQELMRSGGKPLAPLPGPTPNAPVGNNLSTALIVQALLKPRTQ